MKKTIKRTALCGLWMLGMAGCATPEAEAQPQRDPRSGEAPPEVGGFPVMLQQDVELVVFGLSCPLCASNLESQFRRIPGVAGQRMDLDSGVIHVQVRQGGFVPVASLRRAVSDAGFTLQEIRLVEAP